MAQQPHWRIIIINELNNTLGFVPNNLLDFMYSVSSLSTSDFHIFTGHKISRFKQTNSSFLFLFSSLLFFLFFLVTDNAIWSFFRHTICATAYVDAKLNIITNERRRNRIHHAHDSIALRHLFSFGFSIHLTNILSKKLLLFVAFVYQLSRNGYIYTIARGFYDLPIKW